MPCRGASLIRGFAVFAVAGAAPATAQGLGPIAPRRVEVTPILGTSRTFMPSIQIANLDAGNIVAGNTRWEFEGFVFNETYVGVRWSPEDGMRVFEVDGPLYFEPHLQLPAEISDAGTVTGTVLFRQLLEVRPFLWTPAAGFRFLPLPAGWQGAAIGVSSDGRVIGGATRPNLFSPDQASRWIEGNLEILGPAGLWSTVRDVSDDGRVMVGELGAAVNDAGATRWVDGVAEALEEPLGTTFSTARLLSDDGRRAFGWATVAGRNVLVRWGAAGAARVLVPPAPYSIQDLHAIGPRGTAVCGVLSDGGNWAPFVWRLGEGFDVIGELGREDDYDLSQAVALSDDGSRVIGELRSSVVFNGDPPQLAFLWTPERGTRTLDQVLEEAGEDPLGLYHAIGISGDGLRIVGEGGVRPSPFDSTAVLIRLAPEKR